MHAPEWITEEIYRVHKDARLAWFGQDREGPEEDLNKGKFALVQLYHWRDAAETFYGDPWGDRGPIFGRPYDRLQRVPIMLTLIDPEDVFSGKVVAMLKRWCTPIRERVMLAAREKGAEYQSQVNDLAEAGGDYLHWTAQKSTDRPPVVPQKDLTEDDKAVLRGDTIKGVKDAFVEKFETGGEALR